MAINIPIITEFVDQGLKSAQGAFTNFRTQVAQAEGAMGKFKAGGTAALDAVKANAGMFAAAAGTAIAGFAVKAIGEFQDLALEVDHFSDVTGIAAEQASKWIEVTGDIGIEAGAVEAAINRMNKEIGKGSDAFEDLGVEIVKTSDGAVDANETFLNTIEALKNIKDPAERAALASEILGKGWTNMAELIEMGSDELRESLDSVAGAKIIDEEEITKAKNLRAAQDALGDAIEELTLTVGQELLPAFVKLVETAVPALEKVGAAIGFVVEGLEEGTENSNGWFDAIVELLNPWDAYQDALEDTDETTQDVITNTNKLSTGLQTIVDDVMATYDANQMLAEAMLEVDDALARLKGEVDDRTAWRNLQDQFDNVIDAAIEAFTEGTPAAIRDSEQALDDLRVELAEYIVQTESIDPEVKTQFLAEIPTADLERLNQLLDYIGRSRSVSFIPVIEAARESAGTGSGMGSGRRSLSLNPASTGNVNVTVMGSVVTEGDLVNKVRKGLIDAQRNGAPLVYSNS